MNLFPNRSHPAQQPIYRYTQSASSVIFFVTVCSFNRKPVLATPEFHEILQSAWENAKTWIVGKYVIMPDHIHFVCSPAVYPEQRFQNWMRFWKSSITKILPQSDAPLLQRNCWDRQLRCDESYSEKWNYIRNNPVRKGLVEKPEDWPYQGELHSLMWHD